MNTLHPTVRATMRNDTIKTPCTFFNVITAEVHPTQPDTHDTPSCTVWLLSVLSIFKRPKEVIDFRETSHELYTSDRKRQYLLVAVSYKH